MKYQAIYRLENHMSEKQLVREYIKNSQTSVGGKKTPWKTGYLKSKLTPTI